MCGIAGFVGPGNTEDLNRMGAAISYRGPDATDSYIDPEINLHFKHNRLSILDIESGAQPMSSDHLSIVYNGEVYNHLELRSELLKDGYEFKSDHSDTETILNAYKKWGEGCVKKLNGMFAFVIYDRKNQVLFAARDHFGQKPFYYYYNNGLFAFSSELKSLTQHQEIKPKVCKLSLKKYFAFDHIPAPGTIYQDIFKLKPGHQLLYKISEKSFSIKRYWKFLPGQDPKGAKSVSFQEAKEELALLIPKAVSRCLISDVPLGVFLSGGIDSSAVAYFAKKEVSAELKTFSINFEEKSFDESPYSNMLSELIRSHHHKKTLSMNKMKEVIPTILSKLDEPLGDASLIPTFLVSQFARESVTVALGGDGADELFSGYDPYKAINPAKILHTSTPQFIRNMMKSAASLLPTSFDNISFDFKVKRFLRMTNLPEKYWLPIWMSSLDISELEKLFGEKIHVEELFSEVDESLAEMKNSSSLDKATKYFSEIYLPGSVLTKVDRASMMNSLETRAPLLDIELANYVATLPDHFKYKSGTTKYILKDLLKDYLPHDILFRKKKGFGVPMANWLLDKDFFKFKSDSSLFDSKYVKSSLDKHRNKQENNKQFLWNLFVLENSDVKHYL